MSEQTLFLFFISLLTFAQTSLCQEKRNLHPTHGHVYCCCLLQWTAGTIALIDALPLPLLLLLYLISLLHFEYNERPKKQVQVKLWILFSSGRPLPDWTSCGVCRPSRKWRTWGSWGSTMSVCYTTSCPCMSRDIFWTGARMMRYKETSPVVKGSGFHCFNPESANGENN